MPKPYCTVLRVALGLMMLVVPAVDAFARPPEAQAPPPAEASPLPGMLPASDPRNLYADTAADRLSPATKGALVRVYVPEHGGDAVSVIDPVTLKVVDQEQGTLEIDG